MNRIDTAFKKIHADGRIGLFPYLTMGFPELAASEQLALAAIEAGADGLELGIPFSDPVADGATLQRASERALSNGATVRWSLEIASRIRARTDAALVAMTYYNPIFHYGIDAFIRDAAKAGIDGVIVPDLPSSEAGPLSTAARAANLHVIMFAAPTSTEAHLEEIGQLASGFVYCVSLVGTTGARAELSDRLPAFMKSVREHVSQPLLVGFGISRPEHVAQLRQYADGCIVGGAIADLLEASSPEDREPRLRAYVASLRAACEPSFASSV